MQIDETFRATVWTQESTGAWHFVTLPADLSKRLQVLTSGRRKPFGSFRVKARTGISCWETSLFMDTRRAAFLLPIKADVRRKEKIRPGDTIEVSIAFGLSA